MERSIKSKTFIIIILIILLISAILYAAIEIFGVKIPLYSTPAGGPTRLSESMTLSEHDNIDLPSYYPSEEGGYFKVTKDGVIYSKEPGSEFTLGSYSMTAPVAVCEGNIIGVFEHRSNSAYIFSTTGELYSVMFEHPILNISVNSLGYCSVITQNNDEYNLYAYNEKGTCLISGPSREANIFPVSSDISNDGKIWAVSYLDITGIEVNSRVIYISLLAQDALDFTDNMVAADIENPNEIITIMRFMDNNNILLTSDKRVKCIDTQNSFKEKWSLRLDNKIGHISFDGYKGFAIATGDRLINKAAEEPGIVRYYDLDFNMLWEHQAGENISLLSAGFGSAIIGTGHSFNTIGPAGQILWNYNSGADVRQMFFYKNTSNIIQVTDRNTALYSLEEIEIDEGLKPSGNDVSPAEAETDEAETDEPGDNPTPEEDSSY